MPTLDSPDTIFAYVREAMSPVAESFLGFTGIDRNDAIAKRIVWVDKQSPTPFEPPHKTGGNPLALATELVSFDVHVWGKDRAHARRLRQMLVTILFETYGDTNFQLGPQLYMPTDDAGGAFEIVQEVTFKIPLVAGKIVGDDVDNHVRPTATIKTAKFVAPSAAPGDRVINPPND